MSGRCNEIQAGVNSGVVVIEQRSFDLQLFLQVGFKLCIDIFYYRLIAEERKQGTEKTRAFTAATTQVTDLRSGSFMGALPNTETDTALRTLLQSLLSKCVFPLGAQGDYYTHIS